MSFLLQLEGAIAPLAGPPVHGSIDFLHIHNGGSDDSEMVAKLTGQINDTKISIPGNQMFLVFHTNEKIVRKGFHALIMESKYTF